MLKIALCDFNHTTIGIHTETMPLAIGLIGSYVQHKHPGNLDVRLFKFTDDFMDEIEDWTPDVMGMSLYSWNTKLNLHMAHLAKAKYSDLIIVVGGPNIPIGTEETIEFFSQYSDVDIVVNKDGEIPFNYIVEKLLEGCKRDEIIYSKLPGTVVYNRESNEMLQGPFGEKIKSLDEVPSPYLNGLMDKFFKYDKHTLAPFIETNRGCPFLCTFCHTSAKYYNKLQWASHERLEQELEFFGRHYKDRHDIRLFLADNNFGSFKQDHDFAEIVRKSQETYNWPRYIDVTTGKTKADNIAEVIEKLKWGLTTTASLQTFTDSVLKNISRKNLKFDDFIRLQKKTKDNGGLSSTELIMCLPGETKASFLNTIKIVIDSKIDQLIIYTLMNLNGTPLYRQLKENIDGHVFKYRVVPRQFGKYMGEFIFDTEEVVVQTPDFSYEDYLYCRGFAFVIQTVYNDTCFPELIRFLSENEVNIFDWLVGIYERVKSQDTIASRQIDEFLKETEIELWPSETALIEFYSQPENYQKLVNGQLGGNLLAKHTYLSRRDGFESWLDAIIESAKLMLEKSSVLSKDQTVEIIDDFKIYFSNTRNIVRLFEDSDANKLDEDKYIQLKYDIPGWADNRERSNLIAYNRNHGQFSVHYSDDQIRNIKTISSHSANERSVKIDFILKGKSRDFWGTVSPAKP